MNENAYFFPRAINLFWVYLSFKTNDVWKCLRWRLVQLESFCFSSIFFPSEMGCLLVNSALLTAWLFSNLAPPTQLQEAIISGENSSFPAIFNSLHVFLHRRRRWALYLSRSVKMYVVIFGSDARFNSWYASAQMLEGQFTQSDNWIFLVGGGKRLPSSNIAVLFQWYLISRKIFQPRIAARHTARIIFKVVCKECTNMSDV